ncbi:hypothetical protein L4174_007115 [Photobacterium sp. CCB-ST2H9]|uniref:hypothetical protein n=1 Tax=unclassified Photobacterium TaxID=2628852 RepID=UPI00200573A6|nr:hypothetical protein [Photobacterium sp. CCB-ST2H9]UTM58597.1 hypothetical protein L4174_007115 [Photobacterium sp. CCB-ST2H9]
MFSTLFQKEKPAVYLGTLAVAPNGNINKFERWLNVTDYQMEDEMQVKLEEIFCLQRATSDTQFQKNDLILDVVIVKLQNGNFIDIWSGEGLFFSVFYRPKIKLVSRLCYARSKQTKETFEVSQTVPWSAFVKKFFTFRGFFGIRPLFSDREMEVLLMQGCLALLDKMRKRI